MKLKDLDYKNVNKRFTKSNWKKGFFIQWKVPSNKHEPVGLWVYHSNGRSLTEKGFLDDVDQDKYHNLLNSDDWSEY